MNKSFKKLMRKQVQESLNNFMTVSKIALPRDGWIQTIRKALGISSYVLADRVGCSRSNITTIEQREKKGDY